MAYFEESLQDSVRSHMLDFASASFVERYPDVRDGLKPIHRRIIYSMYMLRLTPRSAFMKCGQVVGDVLGKYHPHGDSSIYGALVAMAQPFTINNTIIEGQGNFGNILGEGAAAMRYTECRFSEYSRIFTDDLSEESVHFVPNYANRMDLKEPTVLPTQLPNLLINGNYTIGGAAFNSAIPPHNLRDVVDITIELMRNPKLTNEYVGGKLLPDFSFGGILTNPEDVSEFYKHGTPTSLKMLAKYHIDQEKREIHITELPYLVDGGTLKDEILKKFPKLKELGIEDINDDTDDSSPDKWLDLCITYSKTANPKKLIEQLEAKTRMKNSAQLIFTCTIDGKLVENCNIKTLFIEWIRFRREIVRKVIVTEIQKYYRELHILEALIASYDQMKNIIKIMESASSKEEIHNELIKVYHFTILQAQAIAGMKLYDLSRFGKDGLMKQYTEVKGKMDACRAKLTDKRIDEIIISELTDLKTRFGRPRRTTLLYRHNKPTSIPNEEIPVDMFVSCNTDNAISVIRKDKLLLKDTHRVLTSRSLEVKSIQAYNTRDDVLLAVTNHGYLYKLDQVNDFVHGSTIESVKWEQLQIQSTPRMNEVIVSLLVVPKNKFEDRAGDIIIVTEGNMIKRMELSVLPVRIPSNGSRIIQVPETANLNNYIQVCKYLDQETGIMLAYTNSAGQVHVYPYSQLRSVGKTAGSVLASTSALPITDVSLCKETDIIYLCRSNGDLLAAPVAEIPQKRRAKAPYKMYVNVTGKHAHETVVCIRPYKNGIQKIGVCGKDGQCVMIDAVCISNSASSGSMVKVLPGVQMNQPIVSVFEV